MTNANIVLLFLIFVLAFSMSSDTFSTSIFILSCIDLMPFKTEIADVAKAIRPIPATIKKMLKIENKIFVIIVVSIFLFAGHKPYAVVLQNILQIKNHQNILVIFDN